MLLARVSSIESYRRWREREDQEVADLVAFLTGEVPASPAMEAGTAFHAAMESAGNGDFETLEANGYTFRLPAAEIALPVVREVRAARDYGGIVVTGKADCIHGRTIIDHKTTARFDADGYVNGCQWKFYLDIFEADEFRWNVFEIKEIGPREFEVRAPQVLSCCRYPDLHRDCARLAEDYAEFARMHLPPGERGVNQSEIEALLEQGRAA